MTKGVNGIRLARLYAGYSQTELAEMLEVSAGAVSQWETGKTKPSIRKIRKISEILNVPIEKLLEDEKEAG